MWVLLQASAEAERKMPPGDLVSAVRNRWLIDHGLVAEARNAHAGDAGALAQVTTSADSVSAIAEAQAPIDRLHWLYEKYIHPT